MNKMSFLDLLPTNFRHESILIKGNILDFENYNLTDSKIDEIQRENAYFVQKQFKKLRAINF